MDRCWHKFYPCVIPGCSEEYVEYSPGCTRHKEYDAKCDAGPLSEPPGEYKLMCPRHKGEKWEDAPAADGRLGPNGGYVIAKTDAMTPQDRMDYFNKAEMAQREPVWTDTEDKTLLQYCPNVLSTAIGVASKVNEVGGNSRTGFQIVRRYAMLLSWALTGVVALPFDDEFPTTWPACWKEKSDGQLRKLYEPAYESLDERKYLLKRDDLRSAFEQASGISKNREHLIHRFLYILHRHQEQ